MENNWTLPVYSSIKPFIDLFLNDYNYSIINLENEYKQWMQKHGESERAGKDFVWSTLNSFQYALVQKVTSEQQLYALQRRIYCDMLRFLVQTGSKKNRFGIRKLINRCDLVPANLSEYRMNAEYICTKCCPECETLDGLLIPLEEEINNMQLPNVNCTRKGGCVCMYTTKPIRDKITNKLILK